MARKANGYMLAEMLTTVAILGILAAIALPATFSRMRWMAMHTVAKRVRFLLLTVKSDAEAASRQRAVRFSQLNGQWRYAIYEDGDGDGVRNDDIAAGRDPLVAGPYTFLDDSAGVTLGFPSSGVTHPDTNVRIDPESSPVNFNGSSLCSFSPNGDATPGTLYLTDGSQAAAVRSPGEGGNVYVLHYQASEGVWVP